MKRWSEEMECGAKFWFTSVDKLTPETALTEPIWMVCGQPGLHHLAKTRQ
jgi:hypothetical protein